MMQVDLPALERPTKAISGTSSGGKNCNCGAVVKNLAVCIQPMAIFCAAANSAAGFVVAGVLGGKKIDIAPIRTVF